MLLVVQKLSYFRNDDPIINGLDLDLARGELLVIRGANGSGKTTLLKLLTGILEPGELGRFEFDGLSRSPRDVAVRADTLYLGHQLGLKHDLTVEENLAFARDMAPALLDASRDIPHLIEQMGLTGYRYSLVRHLSAGQKKRVALSRLRVQHARLWLLDEPYSNLDADGIALVDTILSNHLTSGGSALITGHGTFSPQVSPVRELHL